MTNTLKMFFFNNFISFYNLRQDLIEDPRPAGISWQSSSLRVPNGGCGYIQESPYLDEKSNLEKRQFLLGHNCRGSNGPVAWAVVFICCFSIVMRSY